MTDFGNGFGDERSADDRSDEEIIDGDEDHLEGRRLQLIPHSVDARYVFRFEFGPAILAQVLEKIRTLPSTRLLDVSSERAPYPGFYQLFRGDDSVYVGRTIRPIAQRLGEHARKLRGRIPLPEMSARYLFVEDLSLVGLSEDAMIAYFHPLGLDPWGKLGFGSKATGFGRAGQSSDWHDANPADLNFPVIAGNAKARTLRQFIASVSKGAPLVLSIPRELTARFDLEHPGQLMIPSAERPFGEWITQVESLLATGWRIDRRPMAWYVVRDP